MSSPGTTTITSSYATAKKIKMTSCPSPSPAAVLREKGLLANFPIDSPQFAQRLDDEDPLRDFRQLFSFPKKKDLPDVDTSRVLNDNEECLYLCGQSLGLKPKATDDYVKDVLHSWGAKGVHSHFNGFLPAAHSDNFAKKPMSRLVGAKESEIAIMNGLTVNLHVLFCTFYRPTARRHKIIIEEHAFSSDMYVVKSQITLHGYSVESSLITLKPRPGEYLIREEDALAVIAAEGDSVAVILIPGIQYYTGQLMDIPTLTAAAQAKGIIVGVDLAHAAGNVPLRLHEWNVDFAAWCTYKYMNSGPGCIAAIYVHERYTENGATQQFPMLKGWWGNSMKTKFMMRDEFEGSAGADMMKLSNPPPVLCAMLMSSLDIFAKTSMEAIFKKQFLLTGYLEYLIRSHFDCGSHIKSTSNSYSNGVNGHTDLPQVEIITPSDPYQRGSQLSLVFSVPSLSLVAQELRMRGIVVDIRKPNVLRVAPAPLYNSFTDVHKFVAVLRDVCYDSLNSKPSEPMTIDKNGHSEIGVDGHTIEDTMERPMESPPPTSGEDSASNSSNCGDTQSDSQSLTESTISVTLSSSDSEPDSLVGSTL